MHRRTIHVVMVLLLAGASKQTATAGADTRVPCDTIRSRAFGDTSVFANVPDPGHPFGVLATDRHVYVVTSSGFHAERVPAVATEGERLFTFSRNGALLSSRRVDPTSPDMGFYGLALDGEERLYVGDMNGRVLRLPITRGIPRGEEETYAQTNAPYSLGRWTTSMWNGIVFDPNGTLYVADDRGAIWRIPRNGEAEVWFRHPAIAPGYAGPFGAALGPDGKLYFIVVGTGWPGQVNDSIIYRLPLVDHPTAADLEEFHRFRATPEKPIPGAIGIGFGVSGCVYVSMNGTNELAVLTPDGEELRRLSLPGVMEPLGVSFQGRSLLVTSATNFSYPDDRESWKIVRVWIGEEGLPLARP